MTPAKTQSETPAINVKDSIGTALGDGNSVTAKNPSFFGLKIRICRLAFFKA